MAGVAAGAGRRAGERERQHRTGAKFTGAGPNVTFHCYKKL